VIGGEIAEHDAEEVAADASTEPPIVIGGERVAGLARLIRAPASTEPPIVIGGETRSCTSSRCPRTSFNGAADRDRRRGP